MMKDPLQYFTFAQMIFSFHCQLGSDFVTMAPKPDNKVYDENCVYWNVMSEKFQKLLNFIRIRDPIPKNIIKNLRVEVKCYSILI